MPVTKPSKKKTESRRTLAGQGIPSAWMSPAAVGSVVPVDPMNAVYASATGIPWAAAAAARAEFIDSTMDRISGSMPRETLPLIPNCQRFDVRISAPAGLRSATIASTIDLAFAPLAALSWLSGLADRYVLAAFLNVVLVGHYVASFSIASRLPMLAGAPIADLLRPALFEAECRSDESRAKRMFTIWLAVQSTVVVLLVLFLAVFGNGLANLLLAEAYRQGAREIMILVAAGSGLLTIAQIVENRLLSLGFSRTLLGTKLAGATANILSAILLIPKFGILGAAASNAAGNATLLAATAWVAHRRFGKQPAWKVKAATR